MAKEKNPLPPSPHETTPNDSSMLLKQYQDIVDFARKETDAISRTNKWFFTLASIIFAIIFSAGGFFIGRSITEIQGKFDKLIKYIEDKAGELRNEVVKQVNDELSKDNIQKIIIDNVSKRVNDTADILIEKKITEKVTPLINESNNKLKSIGDQLAESTKINEEFSNFMLTCFKAQSDDSKAYEQLARWGLNEEYKAYPFRDVSLNIYYSIRGTYLERVMPLFPRIMWVNGIDPANFTYTDFKDYFKTMPPKFHADLVKLIWENQKLTKEEKEELLVAVLDNNISNSLNAKYFAGNILTQEWKISWQPFDSTPIQNEWKKIKDANSTKYKKF